MAHMEKTANPRALVAVLAYPPARVMVSAASPRTVATRGVTQACPVATMRMPMMSPRMA